MSVPRLAGHFAGPAVSRRSRDNAIVIFRETLRFHECVMTSLRTSYEVRVLRSAMVETARNHLSGQCYGVLGAIAEINDACRVARCPAPVERIVSALMSIISCYRRVSPHDTTRQCPVLDVA